MKLPYAMLIICSSLCSLNSFSQSSDSVTVVAYTSKSKGINKVMNRMKVEPQLTEKLYNTGKGHDAYKLRDGMICLVPDSVSIQRMLIVKKPD